MGIEIYTIRNEIPAILTELFGYEFVFYISGSFSCSYLISDLPTEEDFINFGEDIPEEGDELWETPVTKQDWCFVVSQDDAKKALINRNHPNLPKYIHCTFEYEGHLLDIYKMPYYEISYESDYRYPNNIYDIIETQITQEDYELFVQFNEVEYLKNERLLEFIKSSNIDDDLKCHLIDIIDELMLKNEIVCLDFRACNIGIHNGRLILFDIFACGY